MGEARRLASFESDRHREQFLTSLLSGHGSVPLKYAYSGSGADVHNRAARGSEYRNLTAAAQAEAAFLASTLNIGSYGQICEVGPGNGVHTAALMRALQQVGGGFRRYLGLDFSSAMLRITQNVIETEFDIPTATKVWDVEEHATRGIAEWRAEASPVLALLLGLTIGNFEYPDRVVRNIRASLSPGDAVAIGFAAANSSELQPDAVQPYENRLFRDAVLEPFIAAGIPDQCMALELAIENFDVVAYAVMNDDVQVNDQIVLSGTRIRCFKSTRFPLPTLVQLLEGSSMAVLGADVQEGGPALVVAEAVD